MSTVPVAPDTWFDTCVREADPQESDSLGPFDELASDGLVVTALVLPVVAALLSGAVSRGFLLVGAGLPLLYAAVPVLAAQRRGRVAPVRNALLRTLLTVVRLLPGVALSAAVVLLWFSDVPQVAAALLLFLASGLAVGWACCATAVEGSVWRAWARRRARRRDVTGG